MDDHDFMKIAIDVAGYSAADSDGFRRAMGTWRSTREMERLHTGFVEGCIDTSGLTREQAEELFTKVAGFASFGFNKSHAAAFARTAYESAFLKLFYPAQFVTGLINAQPMGFYPVEVLINDAKRHGVAVLPVEPIYYDHFEGAAHVARERAFDKVVFRHSLANPKLVESQNHLP